MRVRACVRVCVCARGCVCACVRVCVAEARARMFNTFVSSTASSAALTVFVLAQNAMVSRDKHVRLQCDLYLEVSSRHYLVAIAMNAFVCSEKSYSEVSSRDYLIASDERVCRLFERWFINHQKGQKLGENVCKRNFNSS